MYPIDTLYLFVMNNEILLSFLVTKKMIQLLENWEEKKNLIVMLFKDIKLSTFVTYSLIQMRRKIKLI